MDEPDPVIVFVYPQGYLVGDKEISRSLPWHDRGYDVEFRWPDGELCVLVPATEDPAAGLHPDITALRADRIDGRLMAYGHASPIFPPVTLDESLLNWHVGALIRAKRMERGLSQAALAELVGVFPEDVNRRERGRHGMRVAMLVKFALALDADINDFLPVYRKVGI